MKKLISLVLVLVLVFALAVPSFAYPHSDSELEALNEIEYWTYWIHQDFSGYFEDLKTWNYQSMLQLLDINDFTRSIYSELDSLNNNLFGNSTYLEPLAVTIANSLTGLEDSFNFFNDSFFDNVLWGEPFAEVVQDNLSAMTRYLDHTNQLEQYLISDRWDFIEGSWWLSMYEDLHQLKEVLASDEDLELRNKQNSNFSTASSFFLSGNSSLSSLGSSDLTSIRSLSSTLFSLFSMPGSSNSSNGAFKTGFQYLNYFTNGEYNLATWFEPSTKESLVSVPMTYSRDNSNVVVTHYYQDTLEILDSVLGGDDFVQ